MGSGAAAAAAEALFAEYQSFVVVDDMVLAVEGAAEADP